MLFLEELELINFMCHEYTKIRFDKITSIFGANGSGKSAILTAINLAFGGIGRERQELLKNFIRHGEVKAIIKVVLRNSVILPNKGLVHVFEEYPPDSKIVIERIITPESSYFKLNGKKISKDKLISKLLKVNMTYRNPFYFIPQERITSLVDLKPDERVIAFLASLGLLELKGAMDKLKNELKDHIRKQQDLLDKIRTLERKIMEQKKILESLDIALETLRNYYILKLAQMYKRKENFEKKLKEVRQRITYINERIVNYTEFVKRVPDKLEEIDQRILDLKEQKIKLQKELSKINNRIKEINAKMSELEAQMRSIGEKSSSVSKQIGEILRKWSANSLEDLRSLYQDKLEQLNSVENAINRAEETQRIRGIEQLLQRKQEELKELEKTLKEQLSRLDDVFTRLDPSGNLSRIFSFLVREDLWGEIRGPMLLEMRLKISKDKLEQYLNALEVAFPRDLLQTFLIVRWRSLVKINKFIKKMQGDIPPIYILSSTDNFWLLQEQYSYFFSQGREELEDEYDKYKDEILASIRELPEFIRSGVIGLVAELISANELVEPFLKYMLKDSVLVRNINIGVEILRNTSARRVVTIDGDIIEKRVAGDAVIYRVIPGRSIDWQDSIIWLAMTYRLYDYRNVVSSLEESIREVRDEIRELKQQLEAAEKALPERIKILWEKRLKLRQILKNIEGDIKLLVNLYEDRDKLPEKQRELELKMEKVDEELRKLEIKREKIINETEQLENEILKLEKEREVLISQRAELSAQMRDLELELRQVQAEEEAIKKFVSDIDKSIVEFRREIQAFLVLVWSRILKKEVNKDSILMREIIEPAMNIIKTLTLDQIERSLSNYTNKDIESLRYSLLSREEKLRALEDDIERLNKLKAELDVVKSEIENTRKAALKAVESLINEFKAKITELNENYKYVLNLIGAKGEIILKGKNLDEMKIEITIDLGRPKPVDISKGAFSSGEKTLAIFSLLIALFLTQPAPILMLDEFDVYLDDIMLKKATKILNRVIRGSRGIQCILTTTHRPELLEIADKILVLRRNRGENRTYVRAINKRFIGQQLALGRL